MVLPLGVAVAKALITYSKFDLNNLIHMKIFGSRTNDDCDYSDPFDSNQFDPNNMDSKIQRRHSHHQYEFYLTVCITIPIDGRFESQACTSPPIKRTRMIKMG